jgi:hypothetical protein
MAIHRRSIGAAAKAEEKVMNLRTKLAITGLGVAVLMLLAFLTPAESAEQCAQTRVNACLATSATRETTPDFPF